MTIKKKVVQEFGRSGYQIIPTEAGTVVETHTSSMSAALVLSEEDTMQYIINLGQAIGKEIICTDITDAENHLEKLKFWYNSQHGRRCRLCNAGVETRVNSYSRLIMIQCINATCDNTEGLPYSTEMDNW